MSKPSSTWVTCQMSDLIDISEEFMFSCKLPNGCRNGFDRTWNSLELGEWRGPEKYLGPQMVSERRCLSLGNTSPSKSEAGTLPPLMALISLGKIPKVLFSIARVNKYLGTLTLPGASGQALEIISVHENSRQGLWLRVQLS